MSERPRSEPPGSSRRSLPARRARERRVLWVGLLVSLAIHLVVVGVVGGWLELAEEPAHPQSQPVLAEPPSGMRAVRLAPSADQAEPDPGPPEPTEPQPEPSPALEPEPTVAQVEGADTPADTLTAADRLAARVVDPRLWEPMVLLPHEPTIEDVEARVGAAVEMLSDSALAAADAAMRARDWTVEDADGGRWGISPGKLHLGELTLPLPIWFPVSPESAEADRRWLELEQQSERALILESFQERVRAIRERRDRERQEQRESEEGEGGG